MSLIPLSPGEIEALLSSRQFTSCRCNLDIYGSGSLSLQVGIGLKTLTVVGVNANELCDEQSVFRLGDALFEEMRLLDSQASTVGDAL